MKKWTLNVAAATHLRHALRTRATSILMSVLSAIRSIPANKKCWIQQVESTNSVANMACQNKDSRQRILKKNALFGRFFVAVSFITVSAFSHADTQQTKPCVSTHFHEKAHIKYVIDGDTIILEDKRHVRLIGINTPELSHNDKPSEAGAKIARETLAALLSKQSPVQLVYGEERHDRHGRTLAHLFLTDGTNVQAQLLQEGLAMPLRIAPNITFADCYNNASLTAKNKELGLWALSRYKTHDVTRLKGNEKGFYFITGKVERVTDHHSSIWINLGNRIDLRINRDDLRYFDQSLLKTLQGKTVEANGWLYQRKGKLHMRLRHHLDLSVKTMN